MQHEKQFYIDGKWVEPITPKLLDVIDPSTEEAYTQIAVGSAADVDRAVAAARTAFTSFGHSSRKERLDLLRSILDLYKKRRNDIGDAISREMGAPLEFARTLQVEETVQAFNRAALLPFFLNGRRVRQLGGLETPVGEGDELRLTPPIAGG